MKFIFFFIQLIFGAIGFMRPPKHSRTTLKISAGSKGWKSLEFKELYSSATEYLDEDSVTREVYSRTLGHWGETSNCSHFFYDPRTGYDYSASAKYLRTIRCFWRAFSVGLICSLRGITIIAYNPDLSNRDWRIASFLVSARGGFIFAPISPRAVPSRFLWHNRITGPLPFALSLSTALRLKKESKTPRATLISFSGSLYEPRTTFLKELAGQCRAHGFELTMKPRGPNGERYPDAKYWQNLLSSVFVITTSDQTFTGRGDFEEIRQLTYRFTEATAAGACLICNTPPGVERYFIPNEHFIPVETPEDVIAVLEHYRDEPAYYHEIAASGRRRAEALCRGSAFWTAIDAALGRYSLR